MSDCVFCKMATGEIEPDIVYRDEEMLAIRDINPQAPVHILLIPRRHIATLNDVAENDVPLLGRMQLLARNIAKQEGIDDAGYRTVFNCGESAGQSVFHIHLHLLGGRRLHWPPG